VSGRVRIALVGDRSDAVIAHAAIPLALPMAAQSLGIECEFQWVPTEQVRSDADLEPWDGIWCVPGGPYRSMEGALRAIRHAREHRVPFLGTCAGFQHVVIEYSRNVLGWHDAAHGESTPDASRLVIAPLACGLLDGASSVRIVAGTRLAAAYGTEEAHEEYLCRYGLNPQFRATIASGPLRVCAVDESAEVRALELDTHPFFIATLFQPERAALRGRTPVLVEAFVEACTQRGTH